MHKRYRLGLGLALLVVLVTLVIVQGSVALGRYGPSSPREAYIFWGLSTLIFLLTVLVAFMLFRDAIKLYIARRSNQEGSRIRTKMVVAALTLTFLPTVFLVIWSVAVLSYNLDKWFSMPAENIRGQLVEIGRALDGEARAHGQSLANWVADSEPLRRFLETGQAERAFFDKICGQSHVAEAFIRRADGGQFALCQNPEAAGRDIINTARLPDGAEVVIRSVMPIDLERSESMLRQEVAKYDQLTVSKKEMRTFYLQLLVLITLFILFIATWVALFLARQISTPIAALLDAAREVRGGNLAYRIRATAVDELATLVRAFNEMTQDLEANRGELERRRRFIEAVLESIPTGVISLAYDGRIQLSNGALRQIFPAERIQSAERLADLMGPEDQAEFSRLLKRARRTGVANRQIDLDTGHGPRHLSVTAAALDEKVTSGFVLVLEDTSELLQAQRAAAWHEVARRIAHELKNPLTPIALCSERIGRQLDKIQGPPEIKRILGECSATIGREVESVKLLVDEFSQFARFPSAQPAPGDLNQIVEEGLAVFAGRLDGISIHRDLQPLPPVAVDREQFKRVVVNLVDNAAEAMRETALKHLTISTHLAAPDIVELTFSDTGCGIKPEDKEKLFLPYFSTKKRGTGLGLAIVSHIVSEHHAQIRVEDNQPAGARFIIELPALAAAEMLTV